MLTNAAQASPFAAKCGAFFTNPSESPSGEGASHPNISLLAEYSCVSTENPRSASQAQPRSTNFPRPVAALLVLQSGCLRALAHFVIWQPPLWGKDSLKILKFHLMFTWDSLKLLKFHLLSLKISKKCHKDSLKLLKFHEESPFHHLEQLDLMKDYPAYHLFNTEKLNVVFFFSHKMLNVDSRFAYWPYNSSRFYNLPPLSRFNALTFHKDSSNCPLNVL